MKEIFATYLEISLSLSLKHPEIVNNVLYMICHGLKRSENKRVFEKKPFWLKLIEIPLFYEWSLMRKVSMVHLHWSTNTKSIEINYSFRNSLKMG